MAAIDDFKIKALSEKEREEINVIREQIIDKLRSTSPEGVEVEYLGNYFHVFPTVFWPHDDSKPLVRNFVINKGDTVLDVCTGSGVIAINAVLKGASKVVALDINSRAVENTKFNAQRFGIEDKIDARVSDVYSALDEDERFDVITCNPPFTDQVATDISASAVRDNGLHVHKKLFEGLRKYLKPGGKLYLAQANFGNVQDMLKIAEDMGLKLSMIGDLSLPNDPRIFYAFELKF